MTNETTPTASTATNWQAKHVYLLALISLVLGLAIGYFLRGSQQPPVRPPATQAHDQGMLGGDGMGAQKPTLEQMKHMADKAAEPLLDKLKKDPNNFDLLNQAGNMYRSTHQFDVAVSYYEKALKVDPKNAAARTDLASCLYYTGNVDGALAQLNQALTYDPKFFGALLNIGIIKWKAKNDVPGAVASWERILKSNPDPKQKKAIQKLIADAKGTA